MWNVRHGTGESTGESEELRSWPVRSDMRTQMNRESEVVYHWRNFVLTSEVNQNIRVPDLDS